MIQENFLELIYLFVDGEATEAEKSTLFSAIAEKPELQKELYSAMQMKNAVNYEYAEAYVPERVAEGLFIKAGMAGTAASIPAAAGTTGFFTVFLKPALLYVMIPIVSAAFGGFLTYQTMKNDAQADNNPVKAKTTIQYENKSEQPVSEIVKDAPLTKNSARVAKAHGEAHLPLAEPEISAVNVNRKKKIEVVNEMPQIETIKLTAADNSIKKFQIEPPKIEEPPTESHNLLEDFAVNMNGLKYLSLYPWRKREDPNRIEFNNMSFGISYHLNENNLLGIEAGQESFPIYISDNAGTLIYHPTVIWLGLSYKYAPDNILFRNLRPYAKALVGGTISGPMQKGEVGFLWLPDRRVALYLGVEGTNLFCKYNGKWEAGQKIAMRYGVEVRF